jgi:hypothetical protein
MFIQYFAITEDSLMHAADSTNAAHCPPDRFPPDLDQLENDITELAAHLSAATCRLLEMIREFDQRGGWHGVGIKSCAHWLNWKCGIAMGAALAAADTAVLARKVTVANPFQCVRPPCADSGLICCRHFIRRGRFIRRRRSSRRAGRTRGSSPADGRWRR